MTFLHKTGRRITSKPVFFSLILLLSIVTGFWTPAYAATGADSSYHWPAGPNLSAEGAILIEAETGAVLFEKNSTSTLYPASTTKLMTALLGLENAAMGETVTVSHNAVYDIETDSSRIWVDEGEQLSMEESLYALMLPSANDMAYAIAEHIAGSKEAFADMMNKRAEELGCVNTHFMNPHGLDEDGHYTCPADLAKIMRAAIKSPLFIKISGSKNYEIKPTNLCSESRWILNTHEMIRNAYPYEGVIAGKTGHTDLAGANLVTCAKRGNMTLISVIMKAPDDTALYNETAALLNYGFNNFTTYSIKEEDFSSQSSIPPLFHEEDSIQLSNNRIIRAQIGYVILPFNADLSDTQKSISLTQLRSFQKGNNTIGKITYTYGPYTIGSADIIFRNDGEAFSLSVPSEEGDPGVSSGSENNTSKDKKTEGSSDKNRTSLIIGITLGCICLFIGLYVIFVEIPYRKKRAAYLSKRRNRRH